MQEQLNKLLYDKMSREQDAYKEWLLQQSPDKILDHAYEYTVREDILLLIEEGMIPADQAKALLDSQSPLATIFSDFKELETEYMAILRDCVIERGDMEISLKQGESQSV